MNDGIFAVLTTSRGTIKIRLTYEETPGTVGNFVALAEGKLKRFFKDNTLINQVFIKDSKLNVSQYLSTYGSNLSITSYHRVSIG